MLDMIALAHKNLTGIVNEIRQLSQSLVPPTLGDLGLVESIQELCDSLKHAHAFNIEFIFTVANIIYTIKQLKYMLLCRSSVCKYRIVHQ